MASVVPIIVVSEQMDAMVRLVSLYFLRRSLSVFAVRRHAAEIAATLAVTDIGSMAEENLVVTVTLSYTTGTICWIFHDTFKASGG